MTDALTGRAQVRVAWMLVATLALGGYFAILAPGERRLQAIETHAHDLYQLANRNERMLKSAAGLVAARERVTRDVARLSADHEIANARLAALRLLNGEATRNHVTIVGFSPDGSGDGVPAAGFENVIVAMRGTYRNVLGAISDLTKHDLLIEVFDVGLTATSDDLGAREVDATLHATIYHRIEAIMKEKTSVHTIPR